MGLTSSTPIGISPTGMVVAKLFPTAGTTAVMYATWMTPPFLLVERRADFVMLARDWEVGMPFHFTAVSM